MPKCKSCKHLQLLDDQYYWCERINYSPDIESERGCYCFNRATNHDVIKRMTKEELAELMSKPVCEMCEFGGKHGELCDIDDGCVPGIINWLREEVKDERI